MNEDVEALCKELEKVLHGFHPIHGAQWESARIAVNSAITALRRNARDAWHDGCPPHPYDKEWFIATMKNGDPVVLIALPKEYAYDFKTADDTYVMAKNVVKWMQFPDSKFVPFLDASLSPAVQVTHE